MQALSAQGFVKGLRQPPLVAAVLFVLSAGGWQAQASGGVGWATLGALGWYACLCLAYGTAVLPTSSYLVSKGGVALQLLGGYFVFNTLLLVLAVVSPLGMMANLMLLTVAVLLWVAYRVQYRPFLDGYQDNLPSLLAIAVSGAAAGLWCADFRFPVLVDGQAAVFRTWQDMFFHAREISAFTQYHGLASFSDVRMAGLPAPFYHYGSYLSAAALALLSGAGAVEAYAGFQLPLGIFLSGLAAFALMAYFWGVWPALAATVAIVLLPDAYQQGFANRYLSYHFLTQVNLGMLYGIACMALAWLCIFDGCRRSLYWPIVAGCGLAVVCLFYKAHFFVANALLIGLYPCVFFTRLGGLWRLLIGLGFIGGFVGVIAWSQQLTSVPVLRLDGSGATGYLLLLMDAFDPGALKNFFHGVLVEEHHSKLVNALYAAVLLSLSTFGLWGAAFVGVWVVLWRRLPLAIAVFPVLIIGNYLLMSSGLAADAHNSASPYELLNRPLGWAYFVVVAWTAGGGYYWLWGAGLPPRKLTRIGLAGAVCASLAVPWLVAANFQTFPALRGYAKYEDFNAVPACLVKAARFVRDNSRPDELIQASDFDPHYAVTALAERQSFVSKSMFGWQEAALQERVKEVEAFSRLADTEAVQTYALSNGLAWYILQPTTTVAWPAGLLEQAVFSCGGYRVYYFGALWVSGSVYR